MQLTLSVSAGDTVTDIIQLNPTINWSGDIAQCGRVLSFGVLASPTDKNIPEVDIPLGAGVLLTADEEALFEGHVFSRQKLTDSNTIEITAFDRGFYLKKNKATYNFLNMTPKEITERVCADFNIPVGKMANPGVKISRNFIAASLYQIIQTAYTLVSRITGDYYHIRFDGPALTVRYKEVSDETLIIKGGSNLISAAVTESIERMVNQVAIYGDDEKLLRTVKDDDMIKLYGLMQDQIKQAKGEDAGAKAQKLIDDNGVSQKITINNLGNLECITGNAVVLQEPYTGLCGLFWIDSDMHTWKNNLYLNKLTLNFRRMMDEQEAGSLPEAKYSGGGSKPSKQQPVEEKWTYIGTRRESGGGGRRYAVTM